MNLSVRWAVAGLTFILLAICCGAQASSGGPDMADYSGKAGTKGTDKTNGTYRLVELGS